MVDSSERSWDEIWDAGAQESPHHGADTLLLAVLEGVEPGRALDLGCGDGSNAIWLAKQGWSVTAVDFSHKALRLGRRSAEAAGADVEFIVADAATYEPQGSFDLITSFYIQLSPDERVAMLSKMRVALNAAGTLLFVSHDRSTPPSGWSKADIATLTSVEEILTELQGMEIERAEVVTEGDMSGNDTHEHNSHAHGANTTLVIARAAS